MEEGPKKLVLRAEKEEEEEEFCVILNRKVRYRSESLHEALCRLYCLHYILRLHFAAPKSWAIVNCYLGFLKKGELEKACKNTISKLNTGRFK